MCHAHSDITLLHPETHDSSLDICASSTTSPASGGHLSPLKGGTFSPALTRYIHSLGLEETRGALEEGLKGPAQVIEFPKVANG